VPPPGPEEQAVVKDFYEQIRGITARHLPEYERIIGLQSANQEFREKVSNAVATCVFQHLGEARPFRPSLRRNDLLRARDAARKAHDSLCSLNAALDALPDYMLQLLEQHWGTLGEVSRRFIDREVSWLRDAMSLTDIFAKAFVDKGGAPEMLAFRVLVEGLAKAFEVGTGRKAKVSWNVAKDKDQWGGKFMELVEALLPLAKQLAGTERPLRVPKNRDALGQYLHELTRAKTRNRNPPRSR
jgi:hypothetical protein